MPALQFQAHANYGTCSVDFAAIRFVLFKNSAVLHEYVQYNNGAKGEERLTSSCNLQKV